MARPGPQEFPEGSGTGGGGRVRRPGHINELPAFSRSFQSTVVQEVLRLRNRVHALESRIVAGQLGGIAFNPAEFPEGGEGGEIVEIADIGPGGEIVEIADIAEFPQPNLWNEVSALRQQLGSLETRLTGQLEELKQLIAKR